MSAIANILGVSRSNLVRSMKGDLVVRRQRYHKECDKDLLPAIQKLVSHRPTYGYRRITAVLNRERALEGLPPVNHKRCYRIMEQNNLLLTRYTGKRVKRASTGKVVTLHSNTRWASDGFEIRCWNKDVVRVTFLIDTCDREVIAWEASTGGFTGESVRNVIILALEYRFGEHRTPRPIQLLSDNGSAYIARETRAFAEMVGLNPCFTPVRNPESNGLAESFVKTFKRDYVFVNDRSDAETVLKQLTGWFEDYNEYHPHKGLKMKSPREFIRAQRASA